jgi:hypothetical protein
VYVRGCFAGRLPFRKTCGSWGIVYARGRFAGRLPFRKTCSSWGIVYARGCVAGRLPFRKTCSSWGIVYVRGRFAGCLLRLLRRYTESGNFLQPLLRKISKKPEKTDKFELTCACGCARMISPVKKGVSFLRRFFSAGRRRV